MSDDRPPGLPNMTITLFVEPTASFKGKYF